MPSLRHILLLLSAMLAAIGATCARADALNARNTHEEAFDAFGARGGGDWIEVAVQPSAGTLIMQEHHREARALDTVSDDALRDWYRCEGRICFSRVMACERLGRAPCRPE